MANGAISQVCLDHACIGVEFQVHLVDCGGCRIAVRVQWSEWIMSKCESGVPVEVLMVVLLFVALGGKTTACRRLSDAAEMLVVAFGGETTACRRLLEAAEA
jgi:hypothetical protein